ncbi:MAG TPA: beta-ketoacyl-ACP synthase 3 [Longimicrobiales bacterium]
MAVIVGTGRHLPAAVLDNAEAARLAGVDEDWIVRRTGIRERRVADPDEGTAALATRAAERALAAAGVTGAELDLIVVATSTPDHLTPPTACEVQPALAAFGAACFDVEAGFAGWLYALLLADALITARRARLALVIGAEKLSTVADRTDPATGPLFGDGAGAVVLAAAGSSRDGQRALPLRVLSGTWWADGRLAQALVRPGGGARRPFDERVLAEREHLLRMEGTRLFRPAVRTMAAEAARALERAGIGKDDIALVIPHQANLRIIEALGRELGVPRERIYVNIDRYGNTGAATVPIALDEAREAGRIAGGDRVLLVSFGAGATAGAALLG